MFRDNDDIERGSLEGDLLDVLSQPGAFGAFGIVGMPRGRGRFFSLALTPEARLLRSLKMATFEASAAVAISQLRNARRVGRKSA